MHGQHTMRLLNCFNI